MLVQRGISGGEAEGLAVDLARSLAARLELDLSFVHFDRAGDVTDSAAAGLWDVCFLAVDPLRAEQIAFTEPYLVIEGCYLVRGTSEAATSEDVDRLALRIGVVQGSAYALHLARVARGAQLIQFPRFEEAAEAMATSNIDGLAGVRLAMERHSARLSGCRIVEPPFMAIPQAMGVVAGRPAAADFTRHFISEMRHGGFVAEALRRHGIEGGRIPGR